LASRADLPPRDRLRRKRRSSWNNRATFQLSINAPETVIADAIEKANAAFEALNLLLLHPWTQEMIDRVSTATASQFNLNQEDLAEFLADKLRSDIHTVTNPNHKSMCDCIEAWSRTVLEHRSINLLKHLKVVKRHEEYVGHLNSCGKRNSIAVLKSNVPTPEEELLAKEEKPIWNSRMTDTRSTVRRIITEDLIIAYRWGRGDKPEQIAEDIHKSVKTVYRKLGNMQKAIIEEIGISETRENKPIIKEGLRELFASSLQGIV
jgi:hypothetical protein